MNESDFKELTMMYHKYRELSTRLPMMEKQQATVETLKDIENTLEDLKKDMTEQYGWKW